MNSASHSSADAHPRFEFYPPEGTKLCCVEIESFPFVIGRSASASFRINSTSVSREHAEVVCTPGGFCLRDRNSTNGTLVNGRQIRETPIVDGDLVTIADTELTFVCSSMGRLQRTLTKPLARRKPLAVHAGKMAELTAQRMLQEVLLLQAIPLEWQRFAADASPTAHLSVSRPVAAIAAQLVAVDTKSHATLAAKIEWLSWCLAIEQFEQLAANGDLFLHVSNRDSSDTRLFDACADLSNRWNGSGTLGLAFGWEWATSTSEGIALVPRLRDLGLGWMIEDFSGGSTCLEALESTPPDYVLLASAVVRDVADQPRRLQRLEMVKAACDTIGTRLVVPEGTAPADRQACSQLGIALAELASQQNPEPLMAATNS